MIQESVLRIVIDSRNAERNAHALANELESIEKKGDFATKSMDSMSVAMRQLAGYAAGLVTVSAAISKIDAYTGINNKLKLVTNSQEELNQAMRDAGVDDAKARVLTAQVGREGDFLNKNLFGSHSDNANGKTNIGMISWQGTRSKSLTQYLQGQGVLDKKGNIEQTQEALNAQAKFLIQEILTEKRYKSSKNALLGDNSNYRDLEKVFGKNAIAWDYNGKNIGSDKASKNLARQDNYYNSLNKILGGNPENALSSIKDLAKYDDEAYKARKDLLDRIEQLQSQYDTEVIARNKARDEEINQATILGQQALIPKIKERYEAQDNLAKLQQEYEADGYKWTEERKLQYTYETNVLRLTAEGKFSEEQKKIFEKGLKDQYEQEKAFATLARETRLFQIREQFMTETAAMQERYRLEREQILLNFKLSEEQKQREIALSKALQQEENRKRLNSAIQTWGQTQAEMNGTSGQYQIEQTRFSRYSASQNLFDSEMDRVDQAAQDPNANMEEIAAKREAIWQAHHDRMTTIESDYQTSSYSLQLGYGEQVTGALTNMFGTMLGESSSTYRALYTAQQSFAAAQAGMNVWKSASDAFANEPGTVWQKLGAAAMATVKSGTFVKLIEAATPPKGFAEGGFTGYGGKYEPAGIVHKWEGVLTKEEMMAIGGPQGFEGLRKSIKNGSYANGGIGGINSAARDTQRVGMGAVDAINSGKNFGEKSPVVQPVINIHTLPGETADVSMNADGSLDVRIRKVAGEYLNGQLSNPNSDFSKGMKRHFTVSTKRY